MRTVLSQLPVIQAGNSWQKKIVEYQKRRLDSIKKSIPKGKKPKIFIELGAKPLFTAVPNTFMDDFITRQEALI
jgi:hypothetical protein